MEEQADLRAQRIFGAVPLPLWRVLEALRNGLGLFRPNPLADRSGSLSCQPLFIIGPGRSGTTLLRSMLAAGGQIAIPPETQVLHAVIRHYASSGLGWKARCQMAVSEFEAHAHFELWQATLVPVYRRAINLPREQRSLARVIDLVYRCYAEQRFPEATFWGDQSPINTFYLPWISRTFPAARYIHLLRDGRDVAASLVERGFSVQAATDRWIYGVNAARRHTSRTPSGQSVELRYEEMVNDPKNFLEAVCAFADLDYSDKMLDFHRLPTTVEHHHFDHLRGLAQPVSAASVGRWTDRLDSDQQAHVSRRAAKLLRACGYD